MTKDKPDDPDSESDYVDPDVPNEPDAGNEGGSVLSPEELDIADSEYVEPLDDEGRYVVSPGNGPPNVPNSGADENANDGAGRQDVRGDQSSKSDGVEQHAGGMQSPEAARSLLADELGRSNARYGIDIVARFDGNTVRHRTASDDVIATFENLVQWYARNVSDSTPADEVIEILLRKGGFSETETPNLAKLLKKHDLDQSDSIADLVAAIRNESK